MHHINLRYGSISGFEGRKKTVTKFPYRVLLHANTVGCLADVSYKSRNTYNMARHIKRHHPCIDLSVGRKKLVPDAPARCNKSPKVDKLNPVIKHFEFNRKIHCIRYRDIYTGLIWYVAIFSSCVGFTQSILSFDFYLDHIDILILLKKKYAEIKQYKHLCNCLFVIIYNISRVSRMIRIV